MASRAAVMQLVSAGQSYEEIGRRLGIRPGLAYLLATGLPADGSDVDSPGGAGRRPGVLPGSSQHLANPPTAVPTHDPSIEAWLKQQARADLAMQAAAGARTAEPPPIDGEGSTEDVIDVLGWDHNQVKFLLEQLEAIPGVRKGGTEIQLHQRLSIVDMIRVRLSQHEVVEEAHFWPAVREMLDNGDTVADHAEQQEQEGKDLLQALAKLDADEDEFDQKAEELVLALRKHVAYEDSVFLAFRPSATDEHRAQLGRQVLHAKEHAPTRPHPHAPDEGTAAKVASAMAAPLDRARDRLGARPAQQKGKPSQQQRPPRSES